MSLGKGDMVRFVGHPDHVPAEILKGRESELMLGCVTEHVGDGLYRVIFAATAERDGSIPPVQCHRDQLEWLT